MHIVSTDRIRTGDQVTNPLMKLLRLVEGVQLAGERENYLSESIQYLFPFDHLELAAPACGTATSLDPACQDDKGDFQKQNILDFHTADTYLVRGWVSCGDWTGPFLRLSYRGGPDSRLSIATGNHLGQSIGLWLKVGDAATPSLIVVPYNRANGRYEVELWGGSQDLVRQLDDKGRTALARQELMIRPDLVRGSWSDFERGRYGNGQWLAQISPENTMHPVLPLHLELAWADDQARTWDSQGGKNYHYQFDMLLRGLDHFQAMGTSRDPHGGSGVLHYRNLLSNYGRYAASGELGRDVAPWSFDAFGQKHAAGCREPFLAVDYLDLSILKPGCAIGLHRHRDNQEIFLMMQGRGLMVTGDWCKHGRERCFEVRLLKAGHLALLKSGHLHGLINVTDENAFLFTFGGYD